MKFDLHIVQMDRETCEVPLCPMVLSTELGLNVGLDWDHCIFPRSNRKGKPEFKKFVDNPFNMQRACSVCNRITHRSDRWESKQKLIDYHLDGNYRKEFLEWIEHPPRKFRGDLFRIYNYIASKLDEERNEHD